MLLEGKVALVTGAASGIGREIARAYAREGARVVVADIDEDGGHATVASIGQEARFVRLDTADPAAHEAAVAFAIAAFGALHIACNNAGIARGSPRAAAALAQIDPEDWQRVIDINLSGTFHGRPRPRPSVTGIHSAACALRKP